MKQRVKYIVLLLLVICGCNYNAQLNTDSLIKLLNTKMADTTRCDVLSKIVNGEEEGVWEIYNAKLLSLTQNLVKNGDKKLLNVYKKYYAAALNNTALFTYRKGDVEKAIQLYKEAISINTEIKYSKGIANSYYELGLLYIGQLSVKPAFECLNTSLKIADQTGDKEMQAMVCTNLGVLYKEQGDVVQARIEFEKALNLFESCNAKKGIASVYSYIGTLSSEEGKMDEAREYFVKAFNLLVEIKSDPLFLSMQSANIGSIYFREGNKEEALNYLRKSEMYINMTEDEKGKANLYINMATFFYSIKEQDKALSYSERAFKIANEMSDPPLIKQSAKYLSFLYSKLKRHKEAYDMYNLYVSLKDSSKNQETKRASIESQLRYTYEKKAKIDSIRTAEEKKVIGLKLIEEKNNRIYLLVILALTTVFGIFIVGRLRTTNKQKLIIEKQKVIMDAEKEKIEEKQKELLDSIAYAQRIQNSFLPGDHYVQSTLNRLTRK